MVSESPRAAAVLPDLEAFVGSSIVIGLNVGYDLAVLAREYERIGRLWRQPRALDVERLARLANPGLAHYGLKQLCEWLAIEHHRKGVIDDANATATVFARLLPLLRQQGVRTLAEAEAASRRFDEAAARTTSGFTGGGAATAAEETRGLARIDSFPYRHRIRDVMSSPPVFAAASATVADTLKLLIERKVSSAYVRDDDGTTGIVTERDLLRELDASGAKGLATPVVEIMNAPLQTISEEAFVYRAIGRMDRLGFRHLGVRNAAGEIIGAVTTRNLLRHRASTAIMLGDEIDSAQSTQALGRAWARLPLMARNLLAEDVDARTISEVISSEIRILTRRAAQLAEAELAAKGWGPPPCSFAVMVLGSVGRGESLLASDQDNAIVYEKGGEGGAEDLWFEAMATRMCAILDEVGVPLCKGGVMAKNRAWRMSVDDWKRTVDGWIRRQKPQDLLNVDIFFDCVPVHGDGVLAETVVAYAYERGGAAVDFIKLLTVMASEKSPAFGLLGSLKLDANGRIDLKKTGLMPIFTGARVLAIRHAIRERATPSRLLGLIRKGIGSERDIEALIEVHRVLLAAMLAQQLSDTEQGTPLSTFVAADGKEAKARLSAALGKIDLITGLVTEGRF